MPYYLLLERLLNFGFFKYTATLFLPSNEYEKKSVILFRKLSS